MANVKVYPAPARQGTKLKDSFDRKTVPGTHPPRNYQRANLGCLPGGAGHGGIDIPGAIGDPALACIGGKISLKSFGPSYGEFQVTILAPDANGHFTDDSEGFFYAHLDRIEVEDGQRVNAGEQIGDIGMRGQTSGPHIHFEHRLRWKEWCTAINCHRELERARTPVFLTIRVNDVAVGSQVRCSLNENGRPSVEARPFLEALKLNGQSLDFDFHDNPPRLTFAHPQRADPFPIEIIFRNGVGTGVAIVRELIAFVAPQAAVSLDRPAKLVKIEGGGLSLD